MRKSIEFDFKPTADDVIFNLAAVHRTPGHPDHEYLETNIRGAENVTIFAEKHGINKTLFTSSIAPYGAAEELKEETTLPTPNTPYGISKLVAEKIHQMWQGKDAKRELTIVCPGIVYGKGEHGNMTRLYIGIHPARVKKLMVSTNICGKKLAACGYKFRYSFEDTFKDWMNDCDGQGLFEANLN